MTKEQEIKKLQTKEEKKKEKVDNPNHPSWHKHQKDLMTAEELLEWAELEYPTDTINLGSD